MGRVALFDHEGEIYEVNETARAVKNGLSIAKIGQCIDFIGIPTRLSMVELHFCDRISLRIAIGPPYVVVADRLLLLEAEVVETTSHANREVDWQLSFLEREGTQRIGMRKGNTTYNVELSETGAVVTARP